MKYKTKEAGQISVAASWVLWDVGDAVFGSL